MSCSTSPYNLLLFHKLSTRTPNSYNFTSSSLNCSSEPLAATTQTSSRPPDLFDIKFRTLDACKLGIGRYPDFLYDASGGGGIGIATGETQGQSPTDEMLAVFDIGKLYIPSLTGTTTRFLGLPLPPFLKIDISPEIFKGSINRKSGKVELQFRARFWFSIGRIYKAPPLLVETVLTSEESKGRIRGGKGEALDEEGRCRLVGVSTVESIDDVFMNTFLGLPTECIAELNAQIFITETGRGLHAE